MFKFISFFILSLFLISCNPKGTTTVLKSSPQKDSEVLSEATRMQLTSLYIDAQREKMLGNFSAADQLLQKCLKLDPTNHAVLYDRALIAYERNSYSEALRYSEEASNFAPENIWYKLLRADLYIGEGSFDKAEKVYESVIENNPDAIEYNYELSMVRYRKGDLDGAIKALEQIESKAGFSQEIFQQKQLLYREDGQTEKAKKELEKAIETYPDDPMYYGMLAELYDSTGETDKALEYYEKILAFDPDNGMVQLSLYEHFFRAGETAKAIEAMNKGFEDELIDIDTKMGILLEFYERSDSDPKMREEALSLCRKLIEVYPQEAKSHSVYGDFLLRDERYEEARESFRTAVRHDPDRPIIWSQILLLDSELADYQGMADDSEAAVELFPTNASFYLFGGLAHNQLGEAAEAIEMLESGKEMVIDDNVSLLEFYSALGDAYNDQKRYAESDRAFDKALLIDPDNAFILNNYSYYLSLRKIKLPKAEAMALRANEISPGSASFEDTYAWVLYESGKYKEARIWIEKALSNGGNASGVVIEHYGDILFQIGDKEAALAEWKKALKLGDHSENLQRKISEGRLIE
jgi:tetratricopeptide (TPR) repeat protein